MDNASALINALMVYKNIRLRNVDMWEYAKGTLVEDWINENVLFTSNYVNFHMSDFMRYLRWESWWLYNPLLPDFFSQ